jgi:hypothetical protein
VVADGPPSQLAAPTASSLRIVARGDELAITTALRSLEGVSALSLMASDAGVLTLSMTCDPAVREAVARAIVDAGGGLRELRSIGGGLDDAFARLTGRSPSGDA